MTDVTDDDDDIMLCKIHVYVYTLLCSPLHGKIIDGGPSAVFRVRDS